ncbi:MAG TPA: response regulator [Candidatus Dormibacteraeota bacterium]|nr:response regulator [Candidatus Dormibacteraeota bacterium]
MSAVGVSLTVLVATEPGEFAESVKAALEGAGYKVGLASTNEEVMSAALDTYSVILLDLDLAEVGLTILHELREKAGGPPVILLKGEGEPAHVIQRGLDLGASGYILKHRVPQDVSASAILDLRGGAAAPAPIRPDACPFSASDQFGECAAFLPLDTSIRNGAGPRISCSHLRVGTLDAWRLYPRCGLGDERARAKYLRDQNA